MSVKQKIQSYLKNNPDELTKSGLYTVASEIFKTPRKTISAYYLELVEKGEINDEDAIAPVNLPPSQVKQLLKDNFSQKGDFAEVSKITNARIRTLDDLIKACEIDLTAWEIVSWECNKWEVGRKDKIVDLAWHKGVADGNVDDSGKVFVEPLFQVKAKLRVRKVDNDISKQKDLLLKELFTNAPVKFEVAATQTEKPILGKYLMELALFDVHFGKLAHSEESGEDYDLKIASERYLKAVRYFVHGIETDYVKRFLLPIGQDMFNVDNNNGTTTAGTPQDTDSRFYKMVRTVKQVLIKVIGELSLIAPVDVVVVAGNHDEQTSFLLGEILEAYYHNTNRVTIYNSAALRKYYQFGTTGIMFTHGDKEKHSSLGMIFAAENPKLWANTTQRYIQIGHYHHNKKIETLATQDFQGFQVQILPSLSSNDAWHKGKGFLPLKQAKAFLYDYEDGLMAEYTYTVK